MRFEIVGRLPGTLTTDREVRVRNLGSGGALIETDAPLQRDTIFNVQLESARGLVALHARVCHVALAAAGGGYLVGLEFVESDAAAVEQFIARDVLGNAAN